MGIKKYAAPLILCVTVLTAFTNVRASTVTDVYNIYGIESDELYPKELLNVISSYESAQKYVAMYQYVVESEYDTKVTEQRVKSLKKAKKDIEVKLMDGYSMELGDIYYLEDSYVTVAKDLENAKKSKEYVDIQSNIPNADSVPSTSEYQRALLQKSELDSSYTMGEVPCECPIVGSYLLSDKNDKHLELAVAIGSDVTALMNGKVVAVDEESITINHSGKIYTFYGELQEVFVTVGTDVVQGQVIGKSSNKLMLKMKINDKFMDISKLIKEV